MQFQSAAHMSENVTYDADSNTILFTPYVVVLVCNAKIKCSAKSCSANFFLSGAQV